MLSVGEVMRMPDEVSLRMSWISFWTRRVRLAAMGDIIGRLVRCLLWRKQVESTVVRKMMAPPSRLRQQKGGDEGKIKLREVCDSKGGPRVCCGLSAL